jgi:Major capsid protein Gp23
MTQNLIESRWNETKEALLEGLAGNRRSSMGVVLENTKKYLAESASAGVTAAGNVATLNRVILPVIRRVMPTVIANEIVGVQPMTGPVGQIHTLRVRYAESFTSSASGAPGTDTVAGDEALSPFKIAQGYSGTASGVTSTDGKASSTSSMEGVPGRKLSVQILKQAVEAKTRKLSASWTFEAAQDAQCTVLTLKQK